jgi:hypothetical protein
MEIPDKYHQFFELFEVLGMDRQVNVCNFVRVLTLVKIDVILHPSGCHLGRVNKGFQLNTVLSHHFL